MDFRRTPTSAAGGDACQELIRRISQVIELELGNLEAVQRPMLRIEAIVDEGENDASIGQNFNLRRMSLGLVDMRDWTRWQLSSSHDVDGRAILPQYNAWETHEPTPTSVTTSQPDLTAQSPILAPRREIQDAPIETDSDSSSRVRPTKRRKAVGGLRLARAPSRLDAQLTPPKTPPPVTCRQLHSDPRNFPQRRKSTRGEAHVLRPSTWDKLVLGIWEQVHGPLKFDLIDGRSILSPCETFRDMNALCLRVHQTSRCCRALEVVVQAHWIYRYDAHVEEIAAESSIGTLADARKAALIAACNDFGWSEKVFRNKMAIWRGYHEIREAGGWAALVFAGAGLYRFCKYRIGFDRESMSRLKRLRSKFEVAADTIHPEWRTLLSVIGVPCERIYYGHPHDWVVDDENHPIPLESTYLGRDPQFAYEHIRESVLDEQAWHSCDPRRVSTSNSNICRDCGYEQSDDPGSNSCKCFPDVFGDRPGPCPVQIFRAKNGKNNGLAACCPFERGTAVGEFVGLVTQGLRGTDVMEGQTGDVRYQIWQGRQGNWTRFVNHSCQPNCQFQKFVWLGVERILLVSKGVEAGREITTDYGDQYWHNLDKSCVCGESCCRFRNIVATSG